jgi:hypothetical protein
MSLLHRYHPRFGVVTAVLSLLAIFQSAPANAFPVLRDVYYHGGSLRFEILPYEAAFINEIYLITSTGKTILGNNSDVGLVINFPDPSQLGLFLGDEFVLGIHVVNTGDNFVMGAAYDNPDGVRHANIDYGYNQTAVIGFEDLRGGGDIDYNDAMLKIIGDIGFAQIPEPSSFLLLGSGLLGAAFVMRRR